MVNVERFVYGMRAVISFFGHFKFKSSRRNSPFLCAFSYFDGCIKHYFGNEIFNASINTALLSMHCLTTMKNPILNEIVNFNETFFFKFQRYKMFEFKITSHPFKFQCFKCGEREKKNT